MKRLLSLLMCYVFLQAETFALRGGPSSKNGVEKTQGAYSGTMVESNPVGGVTSSVGLFLITAIDNGASVGQVVFFASSASDVSTYSGTITGLTNPNTGTLTAVFGATDATNQNGTSVQSGQMIASAVKAIGNSRTQTLVGSATARNVTVIIAGSNILKTVGTLKTYVVDGFRTSTVTTGNPFPTSFAQ